MKQANLSNPETRLALYSALVICVSGCTTYVQQPAPVTYLPPPVVEQPQPPPVAEPPPVNVTVNIQSDNDFYEPLSPYGRWVIINGHGRCWVPGRVGSDWRPYSSGYWQRTDAGWYWASDEPWGWATYHYGRWDLDPTFGWYWVPETQWAPAWVSFHEGGGYIGWAPLPPRARIRPSGYVDVTIGRPPTRAFVFVEQRRFCEPVRPTTVVVNNTTIINKTVNITKIKVVNNTVVNEGPATTVIEKASGRRVETVPAREMRRRLEAPVAAKQPRTAPVVENKPATPARNPAESRDQRDVRDNREKPAGRDTPAARVREARPEERPVLAKETVTAPATPSPTPAKQPDKREKPQRIVREKPQPVVTAPVVPNEMKHEPKPAVERNTHATAQRGNQPGIQRDASSDAQEKPVRGRGAEKQMKGAKETSKGKNAEKSKKKKDREPEPTPEKPPGSP